MTDSSARGDVELAVDVEGMGRKRPYDEREKRTAG
jgi:hypothetical protein